MFEQSLLENAAGSGWKKALAVVISTTIQCSLLTLLIVIPLIFPQAVPHVTKVVQTIFIDQPKPPEPQPIDRRTASSGGNQHGPFIRTEREWTHWQPTPIGVPDRVDMTPDADLTPPPVNATWRIGGPRPTSGNCLICGPGIGDPVVPPPPPPAVRPAPPEHQAPVPIGTLDPARVLNRVQPVYPDLARRARIEGVVLLEAIISKTGQMQDLKIVSGHPLLVVAARDAVRQWRYIPTLLNGQPVDVITTIEVRFTLSQ